MANPTTEALHAPVAGRKPTGTLALPPYHVFEKLGERFMYHLSSGRFMHVDEPAYELLRFCLSKSSDEAKAALRQRGVFPPEVVAGVASEFDGLAKGGLFDVPNLSPSEDELERQLKRRYSTPWTKLELALAESCNLACAYCYCRTCRDRPNQGLMTERVARQAITWLFAVSGRAENVNLTFFGGEPLLNKAVLRFSIQYSQELAKLHGKTVNYSMTTNGTLLDAEIISYIKRYNFGLMVSLDGPREVHDAQCPFHDGSGSFAAAERGIRALMSRRRRVTVRCTRTPQAPHARDLVSFFEDFGFTRIVLGTTFNPVRPSPVDCQPDDFDRYEREEDELLGSMLEQFMEGRTPKYFPYSTLISKQTHPHPPRQASVFRCGACRGTTTVGADGTLYPCHRFVGMESFQLGNISDGPDLGRAMQFWRDYRATVDKHCQTCWARPLCEGLCPWELANADGTFHPPQEHHCLRMRRFYERACWLHYRISKDAPEHYHRMFSHEGDCGCVFRR